jgi:cytochrome c556
MAWQAMKTAGLVAIAIGAASLVGAAVTDIIPTRNHNMKQMGGAFKAISEELKKSSPSVPVIQANAAKMDALAPQVESWFPKGSGPESGAKTKAQPAIWTQPGEFHKDAVAFTNAVRALNVAAKGGNLAQITPAAGAIGGNCKGCHDSFRQRD